MRLKIKLDPETLFLIHKIIRDQCQMITQTRQSKASKSMKIELFEILSKRCIAYSINPNGKKLNMTLKYHLANLVYEILSDLRMTPGGIYEANKLDMFKNQLHQLL